MEFMHALPESVINRVLLHLQSLADYVRCSAVSVNWANAVRACKPAVLSFDHYRHNPEEVDVAVSIITWLQRWQQQGRLQNLLELSMNEDLSADEYTQTPVPTPFSHGVIMVASFCNLHKCHLSGPFCLVTPIAVLPAGLKGLSLWPEVVPGAIRLSSIARFSNLQKLEISCGTERFEDLDECDICYFTLDATLDCLTSLSLWDTCCCKTVQNLTPGLSLPNLREFYGNIRADEEGLELAEAIICMPQLEGLGIDFQNASGPDWDLENPQTSSVHTFELRGPRVGPKISLRTAKPGVEYSHSRLHVVESANPARKMNF